MGSIASGGSASLWKLIMRAHEYSELGVRGVFVSNEFLKVVP